MKTLLEAIEQRHSVRKYLDRPIPQDIVEQLSKKVNELNRETGLHIQMVLNDPKAFDSKLAHYGRFSGVTNYFAMIGRDEDEATFDEAVGYSGEQLVLLAQQLGLNTCWVGLTFKKNPEVLHIKNNEKLRCVIALGYGENQGVKHKIKTVDKVTHCTGDMPDWFVRGVEAALLAPTAINQQKFRFTLEGDNRVKASAGWGFFSKVDLGIVKYHFEVAAGKENFEWAE